MSTQYLIDMSAWARLGHPALPAGRADEIALAMEDGRIHACAPFLLELGYSAINHAYYAGLMALVDSAMPHAALGPDQVATARRMQEQLARSSHHRVKPVDLLIAAIAVHQGLTVLHVDKHYGVIAERAGEDLRTEWLADPAVFA